MVDRVHHEGRKGIPGEGTADLLPPDFQPGKWDVICQRGKECFEHVGNRRFRMCIDSHLDSYIKVKSRQQKSKIVTSIVQNIRKAAEKSGGGFVRKDLLTRRWFRVDDKLAREKVGQALRDAIKTRRATDNKKPSSDTSIGGLAYARGEMSLTRHLNDEKNKESSIHAQLSDDIQSLQQEQQQPSISSNPFFQSQLAAELEPTPIPQPQLQDQLSETARSSAHLRSELSASTLLRLYDGGGNPAMAPNNPFFTANRELLRRNLAAELYSPRVASEQPAYLQQLLPTVIESRRLSASMADASALNQQNPLFSMRNDFTLNPTTPENLKKAGGVTGQTEDITRTTEQQNAEDRSSGLEDCGT